MTVLSLLRVTTSNLSAVKLLGRDNVRSQILLKSFTTSGANCGGHGPNTMQIIPSRFQWHKYKDQLHFYIFLGVIPLSALVFYANVFIGPATLAEIPEGYRPKEWEYHRSPISRFMAKHLTNKMQEQYERNLHYIKAMDEKRRMRLLAWKVERFMQDRGDYPNYFTTKTIYSKYVRGNKLERDYMQSTTGEF